MKFEHNEPQLPIFFSVHVDSVALARHKQIHMK